MIARKADNRGLCNYSSASASYNLLSLLEN